MTLKQVCPLEYQRAQCAFKDSMIHKILQFTLHIAFCCVLHRCENQEIRCWKFWLIFFNQSDNFKKFKSFVIWAVVKQQKKLLNKPPKAKINSQNRKKWCQNGFVNDPSAGSPTETLLRLLLPLNDQVWPAFRLLETVAHFLEPIRRPH
jgi:hypothetical protein